MKIKTFILRLILATTIIFTGTYTYQNVEHTHTSKAAGYNYYNKYQCTWWAYKRRVQLGKPVSNQWGNAKTGTIELNVLVIEQDISLNAMLLCNQLQDITVMLPSLNVFTVMERFLFQNIIITVH